MNHIKRFRGGATWIALIVAIAALWLIVVNGNGGTSKKDFTAVVEDI